MGVLVQKFGGTSVQSIDKMYEVCKIIKSYKEKDFDLVIVVSAMGRTGDPYATDTLINLAKTVNKNPQKRELDTLMSCGEIISGTIFTNLLISEGIDAVFLNGGQAGILTDDNFSNAKILDINPKKIKEELQKGKVVVIAGFQGKTKENDLTTLGRGGSDTSAVAIGKALNCDTVEIYTDVDGVMTADPRVEPNAKVLEHIGYEEVFQMADKGAKVIHPRAVQLAKSGNITLIIKNTLNPLAKGTSIGLMRCGDNDKLTYEEYTNVNTAVAHQDKFSQVKITSKEEVFLDILTTLEENNVSIDMINFFVNYKAFIIGEDDLEKVEDILNKFDVDFEITKDCAKVTLIGAEIMGIPGIMAKVAKSLSRYNIDLLQTSDSHMTISCLVKKSDMLNTIHAIHDEFNK
ncbi:MAG: aspartate kinase [Peptostreptococcaceae bacterium]